MSIQYKHKRTNNVYLLKTACHIKIGDKWVDGIAYFNENKHREMYVRTKDDFFSSFEEIIDSEQHLKREPLSVAAIAKLWGEEYSGRTDMVKNFARAIEKAHGIGVVDE